MTARRYPPLPGTRQASISSLHDEAWRAGYTAGQLPEPQANPYPSHSARARTWDAAYSVAPRPARQRPAPAARQTAQRTQSLARLAGTLCSNPRFQSWAGCSDAEEAASWVRRVCGISSRRELDTNPTAAAAFHARVRRPFAASRES